MLDFTAKRKSDTLPPTSYAPGIHSSMMNDLLPRPIAERLRKGFVEFGKKSKGFLTNDAVLIGCETRTSSPVRITRDKDTLEHVGIKNLSPGAEV